jgi:exonuclease III
MNRTSRGKSSILYLIKEIYESQEKRARKLNGRNIVHSNVNSFNRSSLVCLVFNSQNPRCIYKNGYSLLNKIEEFKIRFLSDENIPDIIAITEVVPKNMRYTLNKAEIELSGYELFPSIFPGSARRGAIIYVRKKLQAVEVDIDTEFKKSIWVKLNLNGNDKLLFEFVYKNPSSNEANLTALNGLISKVCDMNFSHIVTIGDFNYPDIDWELWNAKDESSLSFIECVRDNFRHQIIDHHTRERIGQEPSLLDMLLVNENENIVNTKYLDPLGSSDHCVI